METLSTVETVFCIGKNEDRVRTLGILDIKMLERRNGVGRADETVYRLYKIGWV